MGQVLNSKWIKVVKIKNQTVVAKLTKHLDLGESEAIALSMELQSDVLIIDEVAGRNIAKKLGRNIIGMVGVLLEAKKKGYIASVRPYLDKLRLKMIFMTKPSQLFCKWPERSFWGCKQANRALYNEWLVAF